MQSCHFKEFQPIYRVDERDFKNEQKRALPPVLKLEAPSPACRTKRLCYFSKPTLMASRRDAEVQGAALGEHPAGLDTPVCSHEHSPAHSRVERGAWEIPSCFSAGFWGERSQFAGLKLQLRHPNGYQHKTIREDCH